MKLTDYKDNGLCRGSIIRFNSAKYPFESTVDFMFCHYPSVSDNCCPMALYCITGYNAGHLEYVFPTEAMFNGNPHCISKEWIVNNWTKNVMDCTDILDAELII